MAGGLTGGALHSPRSGAILAASMYRLVAIRPYRSSDEPILFGLAQAAFGATPGFGARRTLDVLEHDVVFVAEAGGAPAGYEALACGRRVVRIDQLLVSPDHDDEGIEGQLVEYAEGYAISVGARSLEAVVEPDNATALALYGTRGFSRAAEDLVRLVLPQR